MLRHLASGEGRGCRVRAAPGRVGSPPVKAAARREVRVTRHIRTGPYAIVTQGSLFSSHTSASCPGLVLRLGHGLRLHALPAAVSDVLRHNYLLSTVDSPTSGRRLPLDSPTTSLLLADSSLLSFAHPGKDCLRAAGGVLTLLAFPSTALLAGLDIPPVLGEPLSEAPCALGCHQDHFPPRRLYS